MKITTFERVNCFEVIVETNDHTIREDVMYNGKVDESVIENLFTVAFEMSRHNERPDIDTIRMLFDNFLNKQEQSEFIDLI